MTTVMPRMRPEHELVLTCAVRRLDATRAVRVRQLVGAGIEWRAVLAFAERHWTVPLLAWHLSGLEEPAIPAPVLAELRHRLGTNAAWSLRHTATLLDVMVALETHGVEAVAWKGPALAQSAYGHLALRTFADLDILVHERDLGRADETVRALGFRPRRPMRTAGEWTFARDDDGVIVELHWALPRMTKALSLRILRSERVMVGGRRLAQLIPSDLLVTLCAHGGRHRWERLQWIADISEVLRAQPLLDWLRVDGLATRTGSGRAVGVGVRLARDLLGAPVRPDVAIELAADRAIASLAASAARRLFRPPEAMHGAERLAYHWFQLGTRERITDKVRYLIGAVESRMEESRWGVHRSSSAAWPR